MSISIADSADVALSYGRTVREFLVERARSRHGNSIGVNFPSDFLSVENQAMELRALAKHPRAVVPAKVPVKEPATRLTKKEKKKRKKLNATRLPNSVRPNALGLDRLKNRPIARDLVPIRRNGPVPLTAVNPPRKRI